MLTITELQLQNHKPEPFELFIELFRLEIQFQFRVNDGSLKMLRMQMSEICLVFVQIIVISRVKSTYKVA